MLSFDWCLKYDDSWKKQVKCEDSMGYIKCNKYFNNEQYLKYFYKSIFLEEFTKQTQIFDNKLTFQDLHNIIHDLNTVSNNIVKNKLNEANRIISQESCNNITILLKHLYSVAYSRISNDIGINYRNLQLGLPIVIIKDDNHYLLLPEDFNFQTKFFCDQESFKCTNKKLINKIDI